MLTVRSALRGFIAGAALLAVASTAGCMSSHGEWSSDVERKTIDLDIAHRDHSGIDVVTENGAVVIRADSSAASVTVNAEVRAKTVERLDATQIVAERRDDGVLALRVEWPDGKRQSNEGVSFEITVPDAHGVKVETGNGRVTLEGLAGDARVETSNGRVSIEDHRGPVVVGTSNGRIELEDIEGTADLRTSNGRIIARDIHGAVTAHTSNGAIEIDLESGVQGACSARTSNGAITFKAAKSMRASLDLSSSNGKIVVDRGGETMEFKNSARVELNGGGPTCTLTTSNGRITVEIDDDD
jgi:hypothetical protein